MLREPPIIIPLACLALAGLSASADAQTADPATAPQSAIAAVPASTPTADASTPTDDATAPKRAWSIVPRISVTETLTDNVLLRNSDKHADQVTQLSPGIQINGESARAKLHFDYARNESFYVQDTARKKSQNSLNAFGSLEAIEKWLYVDFSGIIAQQAISAFGVQSPSNISLNANQTETSNFRIAPYIRGKLAGMADYQLGYSRSSMHSKSTSAFDIDTGEWTARIGGSSTAFKNLGWSLEASQQQTDYSTGKQIDADHLRGVLSYQFGPQYKLSAITGREANNYASLTKESHNTGGFGFDWTPSERTQLSAVRERRFFGEGHTFTFNHRTPLTAWRFTDSRDVAVLPTQFATVSLGTLYDLMFNHYASAVPDPATRGELVNAVLQANNLPPNMVVTSGFLSSSASIQRRRDLSFVLLGARNTLTFVATQSESQRLQSVTSLNDAFTNTNSIRQRGISVTLAHRLSALSTLNVSGSHQHNSSASTGQDTTLRMLNVTLATKFGPYTSGSLGARRALFDSTSSPYTENAVIGTLTAQF